VPLDVAGHPGAACLLRHQVCCRALRAVGEAGVAAAPAAAPSTPTAAPAATASRAASRAAAAAGRLLEAAVGGPRRAGDGESSHGCQRRRQGHCSSTGRPGERPHALLQSTSRTGPTDAGILRNGRIRAGLRVRWGQRVHLDRPPMVDRAFPMRVLDVTQPVALRSLP
jgi:hypothetical protein